MCNPTTDSWTLELPAYFPPTLNRVSMRHWSHVRKYKKKAMERIWAHALAQGGLPWFEGPVTVHITRLWGKRQRAMDPENLYGALKPLVDAMRAAKTTRNHRGLCRQGGLGIFEDDDPAKLRLFADQRRNPDGDEQKTLIRIEGRRA